VARESLELQVARQTLELEEARETLELDPGVRESSQGGSLS
jgi:hypothetical protein